MTSNDVTIRPARNDDAEPVTALWAEMASAHLVYDPEVWCWSDEAQAEWRRDFRQWMTDESMITLVAQMPGGDLAGFVNGRVSESMPLFQTARSGFVWDLAVSEAYRQKGVGTMLMQAMFEAMKIKKADDVILHVGLANEGAIRLYRKLGMRPVMYRMYKRL